MNIGEQRRTIYVEPIEEPPPAEDPVPATAPAPDPRTGEELQPA